MIAGRLIVNASAPVRAYRKYDEAGRTRSFANLAAFVRWYSPKHHGLVGINSQHAFTDVLLESLSDAPRYASEERTRAFVVDRPATEKKVRNHRVEMDGVEHASLYKAFVSIGLSDDAKFQRFRKLLKREGRATFAGRDFRLKE